MKTHTGYDWFSSNIPVWESLLPPVKNALELGSFEGRSSIYIASKLIEGGTLTCIDSWQGGEEHQNISMEKVEDCFDYNVKNLPIKKIKENTHTALKQLSSTEFDFIYIDAGHTYEDCFEDIKLSWCLLRLEGLLCCDDYQNPYFPEVKQAIIDFLKTINDFEILHEGAQIWLKKKATQ